MIKPSLKTKSFSLYLFFFFLILTCFSTNIVAQEEKSGIDTSATEEKKVPIDTPTLFKRFQRDRILKITIETNTKLLITKKYKEEWQPLTLKLTDKDGENIEWTAKVRTRGNIRKQICYYPPLKIKFKKKWLVKNGMDSSFNDLKLVIGCKKGESYDNLVLKEYLAYQLYENLTPISFQTQLAEVTFIDTQGKWKPFTTYAFFIENDDEMAARLNAKCARPKRLKSKYIYADQLDKMTIFQFMIGNTDWSAHSSHNIRIIKCKDYPLPLPIAYDFDYSGLVNAPYAVHGKGIDLEDISERLYLGICREKGILEKQIPVFNEKKATFYKTIESFQHLPNKQKKGILAYLDDFYKILNSSKRFQRNIVNLCREKGR